jgi:carbon storage regulator
MLVLTRRPGEAILLDGGIRLVVLSSDRRGVRLGIEAPAEVNIQREELVVAGGRAEPPGERGVGWAG